ncbi:class I SAM-dependent methyltransferase [Desulfopila inferna]|uniref:class I SAM-dependent methyltransferase n=1 Tax=Desulfopila inferna TaxID=468528 RepID=UPI0019658B8A|nr:methyltransferase domain-containing protein [Desulfopila inferna]MBM9602704.1 methyltransferase domain-containing protein [Desulfopila inferna]
MDLTEIENASVHRHPWEISRADSILKLTGQFISDSMADIGSGDLYFARQVTEFSGKSLYACDIHYTDNDTVSPRITKVSSTAEIPAGSIDLAFLLDVLEHVENEDAFLCNVSSLLQKEGRMIITVPAYQCLFGDHDVFLKHFRRYDKKRLTKVLVGNDFVVEKIFYFYTSLLLLKGAGKLLSRCGIRREYSNSVSNWKYSRSDYVTRSLVFLLNLDFFLNRFLHRTLKISLPGLSLCAIVKKSV